MPRFRQGEAQCLRAVHLQFLMNECILVSYDERFSNQSNRHTIQGIAQDEEALNPVHESPIRNNRRLQQRLVAGTIAHVVPGGPLLNGDAAQIVQYNRQQYA